MSLERGTLLYQTGRGEMAEQEFRSVLAADPGDAHAHAMLALCLLKREQFDEASQEAGQAIGLKPDWSFAYYVMALVLRERARLKEALEAINQAIQLDPANADYAGALADILIRQRKWADALAAADRGLQVNPEHAACVAARGIALVQLGRRQAASDTIEGALARDPNSALNHANQGWALLHRGEHRAALEHFREAMRINPQSEWARAGIVEAMKARNIIYRGMLRYFLFMSRLSRRAQSTIVIGGWVGYQALRGVLQTNPGIAIIAVPLMVAYVLFALMSWLAAPFANLLLRLDRFGRYALSRDQTVASNWMGGCFAVALLLLAMWAFTRDAQYAIDAIMTALLSIPLTTVFRCQRGWPRRTMALYTAALAILAVAAGVLQQFLGNPTVSNIWQNLFTTFIAGALVSQFLGQWLLTVRVKR